jgi:hypothetical protein
VSQRAAKVRRAVRKELDLMDEPDLDWFFSEKTGKISDASACTVDPWGGVRHECTPAQIERAREINDRRYAEWKERSRRQGEMLRKAAVLGFGTAATTGAPATAVVGGTGVVLLGGSMSLCGGVSVMIGAPVAVGGEGCIAVDSHGVGVSGGRKASLIRPGTGWEASLGIKASTGDVESLGGREVTLSGRNVEVSLSQDGNVSVGRTVGTKGAMTGGGGAARSVGEADSGYLFSWRDVFSLTDAWKLW